jgi:hypothetical protein
VRSASGNDGRKLFQCGAQRTPIQGPRCYEPVRQSNLPLGKNSDTHCTGNWVGPRACLDDLEERHIFAPDKIRTPERPARSLVTILTVLSPVELCSHQKVLDPDLEFTGGLYGSCILLGCDAANCGR